MLPWPAFQAVWFLGCAAILAWLLAPLGWRRGLILAPFFVSELLLGNIYLLFAASLVLGLGRFPGAVALPNPHQGRARCGRCLVRRPRRVAKGPLGSRDHGGHRVRSVLTGPDAWVSWIQFLGTSAGDRGFGSTVRLVLALGIVVWAARRNQAWLLAPALILACPVLGGYGPFAVLAAIPRLLQWQRAHRAATAETVAMSATGLS